MTGDSIVLSEFEALDALFAIAALHGGIVSQLSFWALTTERGSTSFTQKSTDIGYAITDMIEDRDQARWIWLRLDGTLGYRPPSALGLPAGAILPFGRVEWEPQTKTAPGAGQDSARGGDHAPTD